MANKYLSRGWDAKLQRTLGIEEAQYYYLRALFEEDGITQADLGERLGIAAPAVTGVLDRMETQGLVRRASDANDRRKRRIFLTARANALRRPVLALIGDRNAALLAGIPEADLETFARVLDAVVENARRDDAAGTAAAEGR